MIDGNISYKWYCLVVWVDGCGENETEIHIEDMNGSDTICNWCYVFVMPLLVIGVGILHNHICGHCRCFSWKF